MEQIKLSKEDIERLKELDPLIQHAKEEIDRAKRVGIDVSDLEEQLNEAVKLRDMLLKEYGTETE